jgi:hypothetical protein
MKDIFFVYRRPIFYNHCIEDQDQYQHQHHNRVEDGNP